MTNQLFCIKDLAKTENAYGMLEEAQNDKVYLRNLQRYLKDENFIALAKTSNLVRLGTLNHDNGEIKYEIEDLGNLYNLVKMPILQEDLEMELEKENEI